MGRVERALAEIRLSCRDDTDFFFAIFFLACANYQQERDATYQAVCRYRIVAQSCRAWAPQLPESMYT